MVIRVDKCSTVGIKKSESSSTQYLSKILINQTAKSFKYLGRIFNFSTNNIDHKSEVLELVTNIMSKIAKIPCHPRNKLQLYHHFVLSKIAWHITIADIGKTWVTENIDNIVSQNARQWLELSISAALSSLILSKSKYGMSLILPSPKFMRCQVVVRNALT